MKIKKYSGLIIFIFFNLSAFSQQNSATQSLVKAVSGKGVKINADSVKLYIAKGANVNAMDSAGHPVLMYPIVNNAPDVVQLLVQNKADVNVKDKSNGWTALMWASTNGYLDIARLLIENGADVNTRNNDDMTALMVTTDAKVGLLLIEKGADVNAKTKSGSTALDFAKFMHHDDMYNLLKKHGAKGN